MRKIFKNNIKKIFLELITNPLLIIIYGIICYEITLICKYGRMKKAMLVLLLCVAIFIVIAIFTTIRTIKNKKNKLTSLKQWKYISITMITIITVFSGIKIYKIGNDFGSRLSFFIEKLKNQREVEFEHNNIYEDGVEGIFADINEKYTLPEKLYLSNTFNLQFDSDGTITDIYAFVYGKNDKNEDKSYLISYDKDKSEKIILRLNGYAEPTYDKDKIIDPLIKTVSAINFEEPLMNWKSSKYEISYSGKRNWGYNTDGITNIYAEAFIKNYDDTPYHPTEADNEIIGYTVSLYIPGKEEEIIPTRYNLMGDYYWNTPEYMESDNSSEDESINNEDVFYLSRKVGYRLNIEDSALGSNFYSLSKTKDKGETWDIINEDPFNGSAGQLSGITFIDDEVGFLGMSRNGGSNGELYVTNDGGASFKIVSFTPYEVDLGNGQLINVFDFPEMPYEEKSVLKVLLGQGSDGDYNGNSKALYESKDNGETWKFVKEIKSN